MPPEQYFPTGWKFSWQHVLSSPLSKQLFRLAVKDVNVQAPASSVTAMTFVSSKCRVFLSLAPATQFAHISFQFKLHGRNVHLIGGLTTFVLWTRKTVVIIDMTKIAKYLTNAVLGRTLWRTFMLEWNLGMHHCDTTHTRTHTAFESEPQYRFHSSAKKITNLNAKVRDWAADNVHLIDVADLLKTEKDLVVVVNHLCWAQK